LAISSLSISLFFACSGSNFSGNSIEQGKKPEEPKKVIGSENEGSAEKITLTDQQIFDHIKVKSKTDIVWFIDSSCSINTHFRTITNNFNRFLEPIKQRTDLKVMMLSDFDFREPDISFFSNKECGGVQSSAYDPQKKDCELTLAPTISIQRS